MCENWIRVAGWKSNNHWLFLKFCSKQKKHETQGASLYLSITAHKMAKMHMQHLNLKSYSSDVPPETSGHMRRKNLRFMCGYGDNQHLWQSLGFSFLTPFSMLAKDSTNIAKLFTRTILALMRCSLSYLWRQQLANMLLTCEGTVPFKRVAAIDCSNRSYRQ